MCKTNLMLPFSVLLCLYFSTGCQQNTSHPTEKPTDLTLTTSSEEARAAVKKGLLYFDLINNREKAYQAFNEAIEKDSTFAIAYYFRANSANNNQNFAADIRASARHAANASGMEKQVIAYGQSLLSYDWDQQLIHCQKLVQDYPGIARFQVMLGNTYHAGNQPDKARECFQKALELAPNWPGAYMASIESYLYYNTKDFGKAQSYGQKLVALAPNSSSAHIALGDSYRALNDLPNARTAYAKAVELDPTDPVAYLKKGHVETFLGQMDDARKTFREAAKYEPDRLRTTRFELYTWLYDGKPQEGLDSLMNTLRNIEALHLPSGQLTLAKQSLLEDAAWITFHQGQTAKLRELFPEMSAVARQFAEEVGTSDTDIELVLQSTILQFQALADAQEGNFDAAKSKLERLKTMMEASKDPKKLNGYHLAQGYLNFQQKQYAEAVKQFEQGDTEWVYNQYWLAKSCEMTGDEERAMKLYTSVADHNFNGIGYALIRFEVKKKLADS